MQELQIFNSEEFGPIRTVMFGAEPWFVGKDVAVALGYSDLNHAITDHVDLEDRVNSKTQGQNVPEFGQRGTWLINESGVYALVFGSKLESAKRFKRWVTSEVLPAIRTTGTYSITATHQYPVSPAAMASATNAGRLFERIMRREGLPPYEIAAVVRTIFQQAGIDIPEYVVKVPEYEQLSCRLMMGR